MHSAVSAEQRVCVCVVGGGGSLRRGEGGLTKPIMSCYLGLDVEKTVFRGLKRSCDELFSF